MTRPSPVRCDKSPSGATNRVVASEIRRPAGRVKRGHSFGLHKHDRCGCFDLRRNCCFVCRYNGTDRAGWTRRRNWHGSPSDLHYIAVSAALLVSAGIAIVVASLIVTALGYSR